MPSLYFFFIQGVNITSQPLSFYFISHNIKKCWQVWGGYKFSFEKPSNLGEEILLHIIRGVKVRIPMKSKLVLSSTLYIIFICSINTLNVNLYRLYCETVDTKVTNIWSLASRSWKTWTFWQRRLPMNSHIPHSDMYLQGLHEKERVNLYRQIFCNESCFSVCSL